MSKLIAHTTVPFGILYPAIFESTKDLWSIAIGDTHDKRMISVKQAST